MFVNKAKIQWHFTRTKESEIDDVNGNQMRCTFEFGACANQRISSYRCAWEKFGCAVVTRAHLVDSTQTHALSIPPFHTFTVCCRLTFDAVVCNSNLADCFLCCRRITFLCRIENEHSVSVP